MLGRGPDFGSRARREAEQARKERKAWLRIHGPGPEIERCDECGAFAPYAQTTILTETGEPLTEHLCAEHAPDSLKRPGAFLVAPQK